MAIVHGESVVPYAQEIDGSSPYQSSERLGLPTSCTISAIRRGRADGSHASLWQTYRRVIPERHRCGSRGRLQVLAARCRNVAGSLRYERAPMSLSTRVVVRTGGDAAGAAPAIRKLISGIDPSQPVYELQTLEQALADSIAPRHFNRFLLGTFAATALLLALVASTFAVVALLLAAASLFACFGPALRASVADPLLALRHEMIVTTY